MSSHMALAFEARANRQDEFFRELIADTDTDIGLDPAWVHIYPYQAVIETGQPHPFQIRVRNPRRRGMALTVALVLPQGWKCSPDVVKLEVASGKTAKADVVVTVPAGWSSSRSRLAIAGDVIADGRYLGQIAEAVVEIKEAGISRK